MAVEPIQGLTMLFSKGRRDPDDRGGVQAGRVRQQLPKMGVIGLLQLVLDDEVPVVGQVTPNQINAKAPDSCLCSTYLNVDL